jgi:hypothetical protein
MFTTVQPTVEHLEAVEDSDRDQTAELREEVIRFRGDLGLPVSEAVVQTFVSASEEPGDGMFLTREEREAHDAAGTRIDEAGELIDSYLRQNAGVLAGHWVSYRGIGTHHLAFVADQEGHRAALRALVPQPDVIQVHSARFTLAELTEQLDRMFDDLDHLANAGIELLEGGVSEEHNQIQVVFAGADRERGLQLLRTRYGPAVAPEWIGPDTTVVGPVDWQLFTRDDETTLTLHYLSGGFDRPFERTEVSEGDDAVRATVLERFPLGANLAPLTQRSATVTLARPLGRRRVIDGASDRVREEFR